MKFYTSINRYGNQLLYRGYESNQQVMKKIKYEHSRATRRSFIDTFRIFALSRLEGFRNGVTIFFKDIPWSNGIPGVLNIQ